MDVAGEVEAVESSIYLFILGDAEVEVEEEVKVEAVGISAVGEAEVADLHLKLKSLSKPNVFDLQRGIVDS